MVFSVLRQTIDNNMRTHFFKWLPALALMLVIFWFSAQPSADLPNFNWADQIIKKGGHMIGYGLLAFLYWHAFDFQPGKRWLAWLLALLYAATDEFHQAFVPGRHPSVFDILVFDNSGALISLWFASLNEKRKRPDSARPVARETEH
jgi:VanZ family protein